MEFILYPWRWIVLKVRARLNLKQMQMIDYLMAENQILRKKLKEQRLREKDVKHRN